jgi:hypothetical protein
LIRSDAGFQGSMSTTDFSTIAVHSDRPKAARISYIGLAPLFSSANPGKNRKEEDINAETAKIAETKQIELFIFSAFFRRNPVGPRSLRGNRISESEEVTLRRRPFFLQKRPDFSFFLDVDLAGHGQGGLAAFFRLDGVT